MLNTINGQALTANEYAVAARADGKARLAYKRKHGFIAADVPVSELAARNAAWELAHRVGYDAAAYTAGVSAIKRLHKRYGTLERLTELGIAGRAPRKSAAPVVVESVETPAPVVLAPVVEIHAVPAPIVVPVSVTPDSVPAPMPAMTRAARKASRLELAARMRAAGMVPAGEPWRLANEGVPLEDIAAALQGIASRAGVQ